jgi:hypothetical protein
LRRAVSRAHWQAEPSTRCPAPASAARSAAAAARALAAPNAVIVIVRAPTRRTSAVTLSTQIDALPRSDALRPPPVHEQPTLPGAPIRMRRPSDPRTGSIRPAPAQLILDCRSTLHSCNRTAADGHARQPARQRSRRRSTAGDHDGQPTAPANDPQVRPLGKQRPRGSSRIVSSGSSPGRGSSRLCAPGLRPKHADKPHCRPGDEHQDWQRHRHLGSHCALVTRARSPFPKPSTLPQPAHQEAVCNARAMTPESRWATVEL